MHILIATTNPAKLAEIRKGLQTNLENSDILTLDDVTIKGKPAETGKTFEENAKIKAQFYGDQAHVPTIADDGGLMIDALHGEPGVKSRRWPGYEATDEELIDYALEKMQSVPEDERSATLSTCLCFYDPQKKTFLCEQEGIKGYIAQEPSGKETNGYPYRTLFVVKETGKYYDEMSNDHITMNHRLIALKRLVKKIAQ
ncbi:non-canonical purine NTP pyrophosphatase [Candidatus Woesebacteria bacterium]|nr:non-canonical purine NTP pyrophosphatase [Candidatus Woesebacteria bacterium]